MVQKKQQTIKKTMTMLKVFLFVFFALFSFLHISEANDLQITNTGLSGQDSDSKTIDISFDITWNNSWKNSVNNDAVWVFVKYSTDAGSTWNHVTLQSSGTNPSGFSAGTSQVLNVIVPADKKGCFLQRSTVGAGDVSTSGVNLVWDWDADGLVSSDEVRVKVVGIEMVYVPQGAYYIGDGNGTNESVSSFHVGAGNTSVQVTTALTSDIMVDAGSGDDAQLTSSGIGLGAAGIDSDNNGSLDASFPVGYYGFYVMKYEITEGLWKEFFNTLSSDAKVLRDITSATGKNSDAVIARNTLSWTGVGSASTSREDRACSFLSWMDICAFADWAALRPMSELEYEKISRGSGNASLLHEYVWGTTTLTAITAFSGNEDGTETSSASEANVNFGSTVFANGDGGSGPVRSGIFATSTSTRVSSGSGYYGVMELSGNLAEAVVSLGSPSGRSFSGSHGDGILSTNIGSEGNATNSDWPGYVEGQGVSGASGSGQRGGSWNDASSARLSISDRANASSAVSAGTSTTGGRCARTN